MLLGSGGNDALIGGPGNDVLNAGAGDDHIYAKDGAVATITCEAGNDVVSADAIDVEPAGDCESISTAAAKLSIRRG